MRVKDEAVRFLRSCGLEDPRLDAELLLAHVLRRSRKDLLLSEDLTLSAEDQARFEDLLRRRGAGRVPAAYLLGDAEFMGMTLEVTPAVLIPRPETELLVEKALSLIPRGRARCLADVGTGSGAIALVFGTNLIAGPERERSSSFLPNFSFKTFAGYNSEKWAISLTFTNETLNIGNNLADQRFALSTGNLRLNFVHRFVLKRDLIEAIRSKTGLGR